MEGGVKREGFGFVLLFVFLFAFCCVLVCVFVSFLLLSRLCSCRCSCFLCLYMGGAVTMMDIPGGRNRVVKEF